MANPSDRRVHPRRASHGLSATIGQGFRFRRVIAEVLDFNRHGMSLRMARALPATEPIEIALEFENVHIDGLVGVIHNCRSLADGSVRCGIQFRTGARTQLDRNAVREKLVRLEKALANDASLAHERDA